MRENPVLVSELRRAYRSPRVFFSRAAFAAALVAILALGFHNLGMGAGTNQDVGRKFFYLVVLGEASLAFLSAPAFCAGALAGERRAGTLGVLITSGVTKREIVFGKLLGRAALVGLMVLAAAPVLAVSLFAGGVDVFEVLGTSALVLSGAILLSAIALYAAAAGAGFFGSLLSAYLGFLLLEVGGLCCLTIPGLIVSNVGAPGRTGFAAGSHVFSLFMLFSSPQEYGLPQLVVTVGVGLVLSLGLGILGARHLEEVEPPPLPPVLATPRPGRAPRPEEGGGPGLYPLNWLERRGSAIEFLIVPGLLAVYGLFVLGLMVLGQPGLLAEAPLQVGGVAGAFGLFAALLIVSGAVAFARDAEDKIAPQLLTTPLTAWEFLWERGTAAAQRLWPFGALAPALLLAFALVGGPAQSWRVWPACLALVAGAVLAYAIGAWFGLRHQRRGPAVSWALTVAMGLWGLLPAFVSLSALSGNIVAEVVVRIANPFLVIGDLLAGDPVAGTLGACGLAILAVGAVVGLALRFGHLTGRVER